MYKVFRRECLFGLHFECNRFDFDHELVIKLLLKGYTPFDVPVNYASRSYAEGKKVTIIGDPLLWIRANFRFRFTSPFITSKNAYAAARNALQKARFASRYNARNLPDKLNFAPEAPQPALNFQPDAVPSNIAQATAETGERSQ
jgi:hypothetical protein